MVEGTAVATVTAPWDGRRQYSFVDMAIAHGVGGMPLESFQQISPSAYVMANSWPQAPPTNRWGGGGGGFSSLTASQTAPEAESSSPAARSLWPQLR
jgi:hypothetical protein